MKIKRNTLLDLLRTEKTRLEDRDAAQREADKNRAAENRARYIFETADAWQTFADDINRVMRAGDVVKISDIPPELRRPGGYGGVSLVLWEEPRRSREDRVPIKQTVEYRKIEAMIRLLEAAEDEVISTYSLEKAGFRIEHIMRGAAEQ